MNWVLFLKHLHMLLVLKNGSIEPNTEFKNLEKKYIVVNSPSENMMRKYLQI